jgi:hypothetical protein
MGFEAVCMMGIELLVVAAHSGDVSETTLFETRIP